MHSMKNLVRYTGCLLMANAIGCSPPAADDTSSVTQELNVYTYNIGAPSQVLNLYPDHSWLPSYYTQNGAYNSITDTVAMFTKQSLLRDGIITTNVVYNPNNGNVSIFTPLPNGRAQQYADMHPRFMNNLHAVQGLNGVTLCKNTSGCWDPNPGDAPWAFFLPFGMPLINQQAVTLLDYPPSTSLVAGDYLNNFTMRRWSQVMTSVGISNPVLYETTVDSRPIAAPGSGQTSYLPNATTYFNTPNSNHHYLTPMLRLLANPPNDPSDTHTRPIIVLGTPARGAWGAIIGSTVNVLNVGTTNLGGANQSTSWVAGNHPDVTTYQCCPGDPNTNCDGSFSLIPDEQIDFQVLCIAQVLAEKPNTSPALAKAYCFTQWGGAFSSMPVANQRTMCIQAKQDYQYSANGQCKTREQAETFCTNYNNNPCPTGVYTCNVPPRPPLPPGL